MNSKNFIYSYFTSSFQFCINVCTFNREGELVVTNNRCDIGNYVILFVNTVFGGNDNWPLFGVG